MKVLTNVLDYLECSAVKYPNKIAFADKTDEYSFGELKQYGQSIGSVIANHGKKKSPVVVYLDKSVKVMATFMGVLYSGNFYCPIDTDMPLERAKAIVDILETEIVITEQKHLSKMAIIAPHAKVFVYDEMLKENINQDKLDSVRSGMIDTDPVYVFFTSGSTGVPKGVTINHRAIIDFTDWMSDEFNITSEDNFANQSPFFFDLSIGDVYCTLKNGCTNYIVPTELFTFPVKLIQYLNEKKISIIFWVPSALCIVANLRALNKVKPEYLTRVLFCGEVMPNKQLNVWRKALPGVLYANLYGPCEATDACTYYIVNRDFEDDEPLPIGKPCRNTDIIVLNEDDKLVNEGEIGELCIRGCSLSLGYYNNSEKTLNAFVQNPLNKAYPELIYRTGDLVRYNEFGELMYVSRKDFQIKHMGHRIELGEIETAAATIDDIETCACIYDDNKKKIVFFYTGDKIEEQDIALVLKQKISEYMIPNKYIYINEMPYNANGKIDRKRLKEEYIKGRYTEAGNV